MVLVRVVLHPAVGGAGCWRYGEQAVCALVPVAQEGSSACYCGSKLLPEPALDALVAVGLWGCCWS